MKWQLNHLLGRYKDKTGDTLSYLELATRADIAKSTVYLIANNKSQRVDMQVVDKLLDFFSRSLGEELSVNDVLTWQKN